MLYQELLMTCTFVVFRRSITSNSLAISSLQVISKSSTSSVTLFYGVQETDVSMKSSEAKCLRFRYVTLFRYDHDPDLEGVLSRPVEEEQKFIE